MLKALCLTTALFMLAGCGKKPEPVAASAARKEVKVEKRDLRDAVTLLGVLQPKRQVLLKSEVSGIVTKILVTEGQFLKKGTPILTIDARPYENTKVKLSLQRRTAELEYGLARRAYEKDSVLALSGVVPAKEVQDQRDQTELKAIQLNQIDIDIKDLNEKLEKTTLTAPINGTLLSLDTKLGEIVVSATTGYSAGSAVGAIADVDSMQVICSVNEVDYHSLSPATPVKVYLETDPSVKSKGRIAFISPNARLEEGKTVRSFEVRVDVVEKNPRMVSGINVSVEFLTLDKKGVLALPCAFVVEQPGKGSFAQVKDGKGNEAERPIRTGATDYKFFEVLEGLAEGETVLEPLAKKAE